MVTKPNNSFETICDKGIVFSLCALIFVLPVSIALLNSFAGLAILLYLLKKINRLMIDWPLKISHLSILSKIHFVWKGFSPVANVLNRPLQFLALAFFVSVIFSQYPQLSLTAFVGKFLKGVFLYFCFIEVFKDEKSIRLFLGFFIVSAAITALSGAVQHYTGKDFLKGHLIGTENFISTQRINASFFGANGFGAYLLPVIALVAHLLYPAVCKKKSWGWGAVLACFLVLLLACLCWTYSRSAWVGYLVILFVMVLLDRYKSVFAVVLFLVFIFIFLPSLNNVRHLQLIDDSNVENIDNGISFQSGKSILEQGGSGRLVYWKKAVSIIRSSPIYGTGLNTYSRVIRRDINPRVWFYAHNCYLQTAAETGLLGLSCFLGMLFVLLGQALKNCKQNHSWTLPLLQGLVSGLIGFLVQSFFDNTFYTVQLGMLMWVIFGLVVALIRLTPEH